MNPVQRRIRALVILGERRPVLAWLLAALGGAVPAVAGLLAFSVDAPLAVRIALFVLVPLTIGFLAGRMERLVMQRAGVDLAPRMRDWTDDAATRGGGSRA